MRKRIGRIVLAAGVGTGLLFYFGASAAPAHRSPAIIQAVDESKLVTLHGNTHPDAISANDRGQVGDDLHLDHLLLQLKRLPQDQAALEQFLAEQQDPQSPNYHKWLTAAELGERFGAVDQDVNIITGWLRSHGFAVNEVHPSRMVIDFSGTAGQVREAFHTEIHNLEVNGTRHIGNMSDPRIPEALAAAVEGIVSLHDFMPHPMNSPRTGYTFTSGSATYQALVPGDLATIYNFTPVFTGGNTGQGQTVVLIEDSDVYSVSDFNTFRSTFGLPASTLSQVHPSGTAGTCTDPGANSDDSEAEIDVEWASAAAPGATIELASCASTRTTFGGFLALQNLIGAANHPSIVSVSYGESEAQLGAAANAYVNSLYQTASGGGVSLFVSAGDEGAASSDAGALSASHGITVSGFASTPYNTAVGGTDFEDTYLNQNSTYWNATNGPNYASAIKYIPEIPWNDSCASVLIANTLGYSATYGTNGFCNSTTARRDGFLGVVAGSGGPSNCATGTPSKNGVASGTCKGYTKPSWQSAAGNPGDGVRDIPDVSMFAANGVWGHYYVVCYSDKKNGGVPCTGAPSAWAGFGGTSVSSPIMAGIQALINARTKSSWGVSAPYLYSLAKSKCPGSGCAFNDVVAGDMDVNCTNNTPNCYNPNTTATRGGVLSASTTAYSIAYGTGPGWDFATGLGSVNVANLLSNWP
jgi:subtilase family serine protease